MLSAWESVRVSAGSCRGQRGQASLELQLLAVMRHLMCWETNSGPLDEQYMLLATEPSLISNACQEKEKDGSLM